MKKPRIIPLVIHAIGIVLCLAILLLIERQDHLRWNLGYIILWVTMLSAVTLPFLKRNSRPVKIYSGVWILITLFVLILLLVNMSSDRIFFPMNKYCEQGDFIIRKGSYSLIDIPTSALYKKQDCIEKHIRDYEIPVVDSITAYPEFGAIALHAQDFIGLDATTAPYSVIVPLDDELYRQHIEDIAQLAQEQNIDYQEL